MKVKKSLLLLVLFGPLFAWQAALALQTRDLITLKKAGFSEQAIARINASGYPGIERLLALKKAGFKEDSILEIIRGGQEGKAEVYTTKGLLDDEVRCGCGPQTPYYLNIREHAPGKKHQR